MAGSVGNEVHGDGSLTVTSDADIHPFHAWNVLSQQRSCRIERGMVGPALLANILVGKYADHTPLYAYADLMMKSSPISPFKLIQAKFAI